MKIKVKPDLKGRVKGGDIQALNKVLDTEIAKLYDNLVVAPKEENFRLYQGQLQALIAIKDILS